VSQSIFVARIIFWILYFASWMLISYCGIGHYKPTSSTTFFPYFFGLITLGMLIVSVLDLLVVRFFANANIVLRFSAYTLLSLIYFVDVLLRIVDLVVMYYFGSRFNENVWLHLKYLKTVPIFALTLPGLAGILIMILFCFFQILTLKKLTLDGCAKTLKIICIGGLLTVASLFLHYLNPTKNSLNLVTMYYMTPPEYVFGRGIYLFFAEASRSNEQEVKQVKFSDKTGIKISNNDYPLWKPSIYRDPKNNPNIKSLSPNIVILIVESFSRYFYNAEVTPNLWEFGKASYDFNQVYSTTRPTLEGLIAILGSHIFVPTQTRTAMPNSKFSVNSDFYFLPRALKKVQPSYSALHVQSNYGFYGDFKYLLMRNGYDDFKGQESEEIRAFSTPAADPLNGIGDSGLYAYVIENLKKGLIKQPFFLSILTADTHVPMQVSPGDYPRSGNRMLDSFAGMDFQFGKFWNYFKESSYAENTIFIVTGDHSMYPNQDYYKLRKKFNLVKFDDPDQLRPPQLELIPLLIYVPEHLKTRTTVDTTVRGTSLDIAPTIMDLIGVDTPNPFLGVSLVSERAKYQSLVMSDYPSIPEDAKDFSNEQLDDYLRYFKFITWKDQIVPTEAREQTANN
jgi:phosphoglycerol transferase MdoB-like AlkP superfamily enzyme